MATSVTLTTSDNSLTVKCGGATVKQIWLNGAKVYQKWAETNCAFYAMARMSTESLNGFVTRYKVQAQIIRSMKGPAKSLPGNAACAVVYCNGTSWTTPWVEDGGEGIALDTTFKRGDYDSSDGDYDNMKLNFYVILVVKRGGKDVSYISPTGTSKPVGGTTAWLRTKTANARLEDNR